MTDHLPECEHDANCVCSNALCGDCICPELRACEQRSYTLGIEVGKHDGWIAGHAAGVQAARDAVAGLPLTPDDLTWHDALAAIDALRGESSVEMDVRPAVYDFIGKGESLRGES